MSEKLYSIKESTMTSMADTIRQITGTTGPITGEEVGDYVVTNLPNSENLDEVITEQDDIITQIQTALEGKASVTPTLQEKTVTPSTSAQTVTPDSGYDGLSEVTVNAIPSTYVKPTSTKSVTTYTPTTSNQIIAAGTYCSGAQTIEGDANLVAANIAEGVSIFGVTGTHSGGSSSGGSESVETCTVAIECDAPILVPPVFYYTDGNMTLQSIETTSSIFTVSKNTIVVGTELSMSSDLSGSCSSLGYAMGLESYSITGDCTITLMG